MTTYRILSIDGGGIRGIIPAVFLSKISQKLGVESLNSCFDLIAGTSTGSVIAAAAATGENIDECVKLYRELGPEIFPPLTPGRRERKWWDYFKIGPTYPDEPLAAAFQKLFGYNKKLGESDTALIVSSYDVLHRQIYCMRSYDGDCADIPVWEACKASCSAPTYFPAHVLTAGGLKRPLVDGGVFCNNPSMLAVAEAIKIKHTKSIRDFQKNNNIVLISLGTGNLLRKISIDNAREWGTIRWVKPLIDVMMDGTSEAAHLSARQIVTSENYARIQVDLSDVNDDLDDASRENIADLENLALAYAESDEGRSQIDRIVKLLSTA